MNISKQVGRSPAQVALAWLISRPGVTSTILGARTVKHLDDNLGALSLQLSSDAIGKLNELSAVDMGFYNEFVAQPHVSNFLSGGTKVSR